jgi:hypothetical protein
MTGPAPIVRAHQSGGNRLLPAGSFNTNLLYGPADPAEPAAFGAAAWLSHFGGPLGFSGDFRSWTPSQIEAGRAYVDAFKRWRHVLAGDFYAPFPPPRSLGEWDGWQFHDAERDGGLLIAFRERSPSAESRVTLRGVRRAPRLEALVPVGQAQDASVGGGDVTLRLETGAAAAWTYRVTAQG